jgi:hypothetical protein
MAGNNPLLMFVSGKTALGRFPLFPNFSDSFIQKFRKGMEIYFRL